jgi:hypothetical protein
MNGKLISVTVTPESSILLFSGFQEALKGLAIAPEILFFCF